MIRNLEQKIRRGKLSRRDFLRLGLGGIASLGLGISQACKNPLGPEPPQEQEIGNLKGTITGMFTNKKITQGKIGLLPAQNTTPEYTTQIKNGEFQITNIKDPSTYTRIRIKSPEIINRETNIQLSTGENQAEITVIEEDKTTGYYYNDYLTVNCEGYRMSQDMNYKVYFYNTSVWKGENGQAIKVKTISPKYAEDAVRKCKDVLEKDLTAMTKGAYEYNGIRLESNGAQGPGIPTAFDKKEGWLVIYLAEDQDAAILTSQFQDGNYNIICASMSIRYIENWGEIFMRRGPYSQDICEWAGFVDRLKKSNVSIFADTDSGYLHPDYPTDFDINYASEIKYNRLPGHKSKDDIPDYDPIRSGNGSGVHITHHQLPDTNQSKYHNPWKNTPFEILNQPQNPWLRTPPRQEQRRTRKQKRKNK